MMAVYCGIFAGICDYYQLPLPLSVDDLSVPRTLEIMWQHYIIIYWYLNFCSVYEGSEEQTLRSVCLFEQLISGVKNVLFQLLLSLNV
jgi:hypothetical protein